MPALLRALLCAFLLLAFAQIAHAQNFPKLSGRVVDNANLLDPAQEQAISARLDALEKQSGRQLVVVTLPDLNGYDISDYGYQLGRAWGIGTKARNDGALLIIAPHERRIRIEVGYGLEGILTDAMSSQIIRNSITPYFKQGDFPGGIDAGVDALAKLLSLPPDEAKAQALAAEKAEHRRSGSGNDFMVVFWVLVICFVIIPMLFARRGGQHYRRGSGPVVIWGPGWGGGGGSGWGGGSGGGGDGGGFSGGGGSFGGGGASGGW